jgi:alkylation response protein AidB-like acyl-CoA dehydrogenase
MRTIDELLTGIEQRYDYLNATADEAERLGTAPPELVDVMRELRVPMVKAPTDIGGDQLSMRDQLRYFEGLSHANPTAGWTGFNHAGAASMCGALLGDDGIETVFGSDAVPFFAAVSAPSGTFELVDGGVELSGHYRYASGAPHAEWFLLTAVESAEQPAVRLAIVPACDVTLADNWDVMALKGTGSVDVTLDGVHVPDHLLIDPFVGPLRGGPMYTVGYQAYVSGENLGFTIGVCQRLLDELTDYAATKSRGIEGRLADRGAFQYELGKTQLEVDAARAFGLDVLAVADKRCAANDGLSADDEQRVVAMVAYSTESAVNAVSRLYHFAGAGALFNSSVLQRCFRDAHGSAMHHVASNIAYDRYGQHLLAAHDAGEQERA